MFCLYIGLFFMNKEDLTKFYFVRSSLVFVSLCVCHSGNWNYLSSISIIQSIFGSRLSVYIVVLSLLFFNLTFSFVSNETALLTLYSLGISISAGNSSVIRCMYSLLPLRVVVPHSADCSPPASVP